MNNCQNHPQKPAQYRCSNCEVFFCESCLTIRKLSETFTAYICRVCGGKCEPTAKGRGKKFLKGGISLMGKARDSFGTVPKTIIQRPNQKQLHEVASNFWLCLPGTFIFPLRRMGAAIILVLGVLFFACDWPLRYFHSWGIFLLTILTTYFLVFLFKTEEDSSRGSAAIGPLPDLKYWLEMVQPAVYAGIAILICFAPASLYFLNSLNLDFVFRSLLGIGIFLFPMFMVRVVVMRDPYALNPFWVISSIAKTFIPYIFVCLWIAVIMSGQFYVNTEYLTDLGILGLALSQWLMVYMWIVLMRLLGLFARFYAGKLSP